MEKGVERAVRDALKRARAPGRGARRRVAVAHRPRPRGLLPHPAGRGVGEPRALRRRAVRTPRRGPGPPRDLPPHARQGLRPRGEAADDPRHVRALGRLLRCVLREGAEGAHAHQAGVRSRLREGGRDRDADLADRRVQDRPEGERSAVDVPQRHLHAAGEHQRAAGDLASLRPVGRTAGRPADHRELVPGGHDVPRRGRVRAGAPSTTRCARRSRHESHTTPADEHEGRAHPGERHPPLLRSHRRGRGRDLARRRGAGLRHARALPRGGDPVDQGRQDEVHVELRHQAAARSDQRAHREAARRPLRRRSRDHRDRRRLRGRRSRDARDAQRRRRGHPRGPVVRRVRARHRARRRRARPGADARGERLPLASRRRRGRDHAADPRDPARLPEQPDRRGPREGRTSKGIAALAAEHDLLVYADEIYDRLVYGDRAPARSSPRPT